MSSTTTPHLLRFMTYHPEFMTRSPKSSKQAEPAIILRLFTGFLIDEARCPPTEESPRTTNHDDQNTVLTTDKSNGSGRKPVEIWYIFTYVFSTDIVPGFVLCSLPGFHGLSIPS